LAPPSPVLPTTARPASGGPDAPEAFGGGETSVLAMHDDGEVTSATSAVDLERPLAGPLPTVDLKLEHGVNLAPAMEAVDLRRAGGSSARPPRLH